MSNPIAPKPRKDGGKPKLRTPPRKPETAVADFDRQPTVRFTALLVEGWRGYESVAVRPAKNRKAVIPPPCLRTAPFPRSRTNGTPTTWTGAMTGSSLPTASPPPASRRRGKNAFCLSKFPHRRDFDGVHPDGTPEKGHANRPAAGKAASEFSVKEAGICPSRSTFHRAEKVRSPSCPDNLPEAAGSCKLCGESPFALGFFHKRKKSVFSQPKDFTVVSQKPSHFLKSTDPPFPAAMRQNKILENGSFSILTLYSKITINILYLLLIFT
jgi:hypothetical protein